MEDVNENLTNDEWVWLDTKQVSLDIPKPIKDRKPSDSFLVDAQLSESTRLLEVRRLDKLARRKRALRKRKKYTRKRGTVHPKKKEATRRRLLVRQWARKPYSCVIRGYGSHAVDRKQWDRLIAPLWEKYNPADLTVRKYRGYGLKGKPFTVYSLDIIHSTLGVVYNGNSQELYDLSERG